jgi:hypothetical protein
MLAVSIQLLNPVALILLLELVKTIFVAGPGTELIVTVAVVILPVNNVIVLDPTETVLLTEIVAVPFNGMTCFSVTDPSTHVTAEPPVILNVTGFEYEVTKLLNASVIRIVTVLRLIPFAVIVETLIDTEITDAAPGTSWITAVPAVNDVPVTVTVLNPIYPVPFTPTVAVPLEHGIDCGDTEPSAHVAVPPAAVKENVTLFE